MIFWYRHIPTNQDKTQQWVDNEFILIMQLNVCCSLSNAKLRFLYLLQGSRDNMSIIIIAFPAAPKVDPEALRKEEELNKLIKQKVTGEHFI